MNAFLILSPAYERDYQNRAAIVADLRAGKDFVQHSGRGGRYANLVDIKGTGYTHLEVRYGKELQKVCMINVAKELA
jgi:hypothetical protein